MKDKATELVAELHDGVCQTLTAVNLQASVLAKKLGKACPELSADFEELEKLIGRARAEVNGIVKR